MDDEFKLPEDLKGGPIPTEEVLANIRATAEFDVPFVRKQKGHGGNLIFVAGGPSLLGSLEELKKRQDEFIMTSNHTHDYLLENGIKPKAVLIIDPRKDTPDCIQNWQKDCQYYFSTVCNPRMFSNAIAAGIKPKKVIAAYGMEGEEDIKLQRTIYSPEGHDFLVGGTMTPLRAMNFAVMLGYRSMEFYGFDSCYGSQEPPVVYEDDPRFEACVKSGLTVYKDLDNGDRKYVIEEPTEGGFFYAYKKKREENIQIAKTPDGRTFLTSPGFAHQAKQFIKWVDRLEGRLDITCHGDGLNQHILQLHRDSLEKQKIAIGDRRWTQKYGELQRTMHDEQKYGLWGDHDLELINRAVGGLYHQVRRPLSFMDYGAGNGSLGLEVEKFYRSVSVTNYDPFHPKWRDNPEPGIHDVVNCADVMEHVEGQCVDNTISYIADHCRYVAVFSIALEEAKKELPDGRNAHITLKPVKWWMDRISRKFHVVEALTNGDSLVMICQKPDAKEYLNAEKSKANSISEAA